MLSALRFVASAVAKKDFIPELTHFKIENGRITSFNGQLGLSSSIDIDLNLQPQAFPFIKAVSACPDEVIALSLTAAGKLAVKSGKFRAYINCIQDDIAYFVKPEGKVVELSPTFMDGIKAVAPCIGVDASRPWAMGIKLHKESMFATNNAMLVEYWHGTPMPFDAVIPTAAINELLRINQTPSRVQLTEQSISFWFGEDRWIRSQLLTDEGWPTDRVGALMGGFSADNLTPFPEGFFEAVETLKPFLDEKGSGSIYVSPTHLSTSQTNEDGASIEVGMPVKDLQAYHHKHLLILQEVADVMDWTHYPQRCQFRKGDRLRGVIIGQKV